MFKNIGLDQVVLVDESDHPLGVMDKHDAHRGAGQLHRAVSVFLFRKVDAGWQLLLQQRSSQKIVGAGQWSNTVCGNVRPGETYLECASRRLKEELGIVGVDLTPLTKFVYQVTCGSEMSEYEMDQFYGAVATELILDTNPAEVISIDWLDWPNKVSDSSKKEHTPWFNLFLAQPSLLTEVNNFLGAQE